MQEALYANRIILQLLAIGLFREPEPETEAETSGANAEPVFQRCCLCYDHADGEESDDEY